MSRKWKLLLTKNPNPRTLQYSLFTISIPTPVEPMRPDPKMNARPQLNLIHYDDHKNENQQLIDLLETDKEDTIVQQLPGRFPNDSFRSITISTTKPIIVNRLIAQTSRPPK
jgi:hypothetical protein